MNDEEMEVKLQKTIYTTVRDVMLRLQADADRDEFLRSTFFMTGAFTMLRLAAGYAVMALAETLIDHGKERGGEELAASTQLSRSLPTDPWQEESTEIYAMASRVRNALFKALNASVNLELKRPRRPKSKEEEQP